MIRRLMMMSRYKLDKTNITNDLSQERPQWILSAYGPGRDAPLQLFGGFPREQSFEEMRIRHYELAAQGNQQLAVQEAQTLVSNAEQQIQTTLNNIDGAIKYIIDGENEHPNRIDICKAKGASPAPPLDFRSNQEPTSTLVQPSCSAPAFGQLSAPSIFDRPLGPALGQTSVPKSSFGQPTTSTFGQPSAFGQPATLGRPTTSFGQPSTFGKPSNPSTAFGQPSAPTLFQTPQQNPSPFNAPLGPNVNAQTSSTTNNPFGQSLAPAQPNLFGQPPAPSQPNVFGKPSTPNIPITFGQPQLSEGGFPPNTTGSANGLGQTIAPTTDSFGQPFTAAPNTFAQRRSSQVAAANVPVPSFGHQSAPDSSRPSSGPSLNGTASRTLSGHETNGVQIQKDEQGNIKNWKGLPVSYVDGEPCCKGDDGSWQRIWFPDGPPVFTKTVDLPDEAYDEATKANYRHLREYGTFKDGVMPELPPRREWCSWSF